MPEVWVSDGADGLYRQRRHAAKCDEGKVKMSTWRELLLLITPKLTLTYIRLRFAATGIIWAVVWLDGRPVKSVSDTSADYRPCDM